MVRNIGHLDSQGGVAHRISQVMLNNGENIMGGAAGRGTAGDLEAGRLRFKSWPFCDCCVPVRGHPSFLSYSYFICKMEIMFIVLALHMGKRACHGCHVLENPVGGRSPQGERAMGPEVTTPSCPLLPYSVL